MTTTVLRFDKAIDLKKYADSLDRTKCSMSHAHLWLLESKYSTLNFFVPIWHEDCNGNKLWASYDYENYEYIFVKD